MNHKPFLKEISLKTDNIENFNQYPFNIPAISKLDRIEFHPDVTFIVGENGSGKSTLIEAIALSQGFGPEGGTLNMQFETSKNTSELYQYLRVVRGTKRPYDYYFLRAESFYNVATYMDQTGGNPFSLHEFSHGESFLKTITEKLRGNGLYIFDEPEAALSPNRQLSALVAIHEHVKNNSQFIIATHSPILMAYPGARIIQLTDDGPKKVSYEETEHFQVTRQFLSNHKNMVKLMFES